MVCGVPAAGRRTARSSRRVHRRRTSRRAPLRRRPPVRGRGLFRLEQHHASLLTSRSLHRTRLPAQGVTRRSSRRFVRIAGRWAGIRWEDGAGRAGRSGMVTEGAAVTALLTGLPSAGKSTVAGATAVMLTGRGHRAEVLDGDVVRALLWPELGFSRADRQENLRRVARVANLLARNGIVVVIAAIAPFSPARRAMRALHEEQGVDFLEVYVETPLAVCRERDVKG